MFFLQFFAQVKEWIKLEMYGMIGMLLFVLRRQGRVVKEWSILGVSCHGQFKAWNTLSFADVVSFVSLILYLVAFCL